MRKVLVRSLSTAAVLVALSGVAMAQDSEIQSVDADITSALQLDVDSPLAPSPWMLTSGITNVNGTSLALRAYGNVQYGIQQQCDFNALKGGNDNRLFEYAAGLYAAVTLHPDGGSPKYINAPLQIRQVGAGAAIVIDTVAATLPGVTNQLTTPVAGRLHPIEISQLVDFGDKSLLGTGSAYHMDITFTIMPGI